MKKTVGGYAHEHITGKDNLVFIQRLRSFWPSANEDTQDLDRLILVDKNAHELLEWIGGQTSQYSKEWATCCTAKLATVLFSREK